MKKHKQKGFTIVELLVVVVIIAILASIILVSYNGIVGRAENSRRLAAVDAWTKALLLYKTENGAFPNPEPQYPTNQYCIGSSFEQTSDFPVDTCLLYNDTSNGQSLTIKQNSALNNAIKTVTSIPPTDFPPLIVINGTTTTKERGLLYIINTASQTASIFYDVKGDVDCARGVKSGDPSTTGLSRCTVTLQ